MAKDDLIYAVTRVKYAESKLLSAGDISALIHLPTSYEAILYLKNSGWFDDTVPDVYSFEKVEITRLWRYLLELVPDKNKLAPLLLFNDYQNVKTILKYKYNNIEYKNNLAAYTFYSYTDIEETLSSHSIDQLPKEMHAPAREAYNALFTTGDGALAETFIDTAMLKHVSDVTKKLKINDYFDKYITYTNIKVALRAVTYGRSREYLDIALVPCKNIDISQLSCAALHGIEAMYAILNSLGFSDAVEVWKNNKSNFDQYINTQFYNELQKYKYEYSGLMPIICYFYYKIKEIRAVRSILVGIDSGLSEDYMESKIFF